MGLVGPPEVSPGDHACCAFATDDEQALVVGKFARDAVNRRNQIFYLADKSDEAQVAAFLEEVGLDGRKMLDSGELQVVHSSAMELDDGFDRTAMVQSWKERLADARVDGYTGLSAAAEMTWALNWGLDVDTLVEYERVVETAFASGHLAGLCQYDRRRFDPDTLARTGHVHRYAMEVDEEGVAIDYNRLKLHLGHRDLALGGEIDLANVTFLEQQLSERLANGDAVADLSELSFIDARGCRVLHEATKGSHGPGHLTLSDVPEPVARVMRVYQALEATR